MDDLIDYLQRRLLWDIKKEYSDVDCFDWNDLVDVLERFNQFLVGRQKSDDHYKDDTNNKILIHSLGF